MACKCPGHKYLCEPPLHILAREIVMMLIKQNAIFKHQYNFRFEKTTFLCSSEYRAGAEGEEMGLVRITSWHPNFNGSHFGLPPSEIHRMIGLPPKIV